MGRISSSIVRTLAQPLSENYFVFTTVSSLWISRNFLDSCKNTILRWEHAVDLSKIVEKKYFRKIVTFPACVLMYILVLNLWTVFVVLSTCRLWEERYFTIPRVHVANGSPSKELFHWFLCALSLVFASRTERWNRSNYPDRIHQSLGVWVEWTSFCQ